ncbi:MAG: hypothetical protein ACRCWQ_10780 [Bacilli bacterium]
MKLDERFIIAPIRSKGGQPGPIGPQGPKGENGVDGLPPEHEWDATKLKFKNPDGTWGQEVDLKGEKGDSGGSVPGQTSIQVEDQSGNKNDLSVVKYKSNSEFIKYDPSDTSLSINAPERVFDIKWSVDKVSDLPNGTTAIAGSLAYALETSKTYQYNGTAWLEVDFEHHPISAIDLDKILTPGKWITEKLSIGSTSIVLDSKETFLGIYDTLDDLEKSKADKIAGQTFAIVKCASSNRQLETNKMFVFTGISGGVDLWSPIEVSGNLILSTTGNSAAIGEFKSITAGDNVTIDYDTTNKNITIKSLGPGAPTDLSEYLKGSNVRSKFPASDWLEISWDSLGKILNVGVKKPDFDKMNDILVAGNNISFEKDASGFLKINAEAHVDLTNYVMGALTEGQNGIKTNFDQANQKLTLGYEPKYADLDLLVEAGNNITLEQGTGEKVKVSAVIPPPIPVDLSEYAKKSNIKIPLDDWGTTDVVGEEVQLKIKPTATQFADMITSNGDTIAIVNGNQVDLKHKDMRKKLYNILTKKSTQNEAILQAGNHIHLDTSDTDKTITIVSTAREYDSASVDVVLPLTSTWDSTKDQKTIELNLAEFANLTDAGHSNVKVEYDGASHKLKYNVDRSLIPVVAIQKDASGNEESLGVLQINNSGNNLVIQDDSGHPGKKRAVLTLPDFPTQLTGEFGTDTGPLTKLILKGEVTEQVAFDTVKNEMTINLDKSYYVGKHADQSNLPTTGIANKSFGFIGSGNGYDNILMHDGTNWTAQYPVTGMLAVESGATPTYKVVKQIKMNPAVTIDANGELTINQGGLQFVHNGQTDGLNSLEVAGTGVTADFDSGTGALKLNIVAGGSGTVSPLKVSKKTQDGSVTEYDDTRVLLFDGDVEGITVEDITTGGKKVTVPTGIIVETDTDVTQLTTKYVPAKYKGKFVFNYSNDATNRRWFACDGEEWFTIGSENLTKSLQDILSRLPARIPKGTSLDTIKDKTGWTYFGETVTGLPEYTKHDGSKIIMPGHVMNLVETDDKVHQSFFPIGELQYPMYRSWDSVNSKWNDWSNGDNELKLHNSDPDAHELLILPAISATTKSNWFSLYDDRPNASRKGNLPIMLLSDSTGKADVNTNPTGNDLYSLNVPRTGTYNIRYVFQLSGVATSHGTLTLSIIKNNTTVIKTAVQSISTSGQMFDAYETMATDIPLAVNDAISFKVEYTGSSTWTEDFQKKSARIDPMKNYFVLEHKDTKSASHIANTFRTVLGGLAITKGYEAFVMAGDAQGSAPQFVEVVGSIYNENVVVIK